MSTTATVVIVLGVGGAAFLFWRSQQQQQAALAAAAAAPAAASRPGGIAGLANGLFQQWKGDPLGIKNAGAVLGTGVSVVRSGANEVSGLVHSIGSTIGGLF